MPFTLSHAAAVLPLVRRTGAARGPLVASALVAGSFAPDVTYYAGTVVPGGMAFGAVTHAPVGVVTVDVLLTAVSVGGWLLVRVPLLALLPPGGGSGSGRSPGAGCGGRGRCANGRRWWGGSRCRRCSARRPTWCGTPSPIPAAGAPRLVPALNTVVGDRPLAMYVQYGTSALALVGIGWFLWTALRRRPAAGGGGAGRAAPELSLRLRVLLAAPVVLGVLLGAGYRTVRAYAVHGAAVGWFDYLPDLLFGAGAGLVPGLLACAAAFRLVVRRTRLRGAAADGTAPGRPAGAGAA